MRHKCIRCGVCCICATCNVGEESPTNGLCNYLTIHKEGYTSCKHASENPDLFSLFGKGCPIRIKGTIDIYKVFKAQAELMVGRSLNGIGDKNV